MPRGVPQIEIAYDVDANGILNVSASEKSTGKSNKITITNDKSRSKEDIEKMIQEAEKYAADDKRIMERVEARNGAEAYLYNARNTLREEKVKEKLGTEDIDAVEKVVADGLAWLDENREADADEVKAKQKEWEEIIRPVLMKLYEAAGAPSSAEGAPAGAEAETGPRVEEVD
jgi:L1 cell adhesion molecule like protein